MGLRIPAGAKVRMSVVGREQLAQSSPAHVDEFGGCEGVVIGLVFPDSPDADEIDVRWQPSGLRFGYPPAYLEQT